MSASEYVERYKSMTPKERYAIMKPYQARALLKSIRYWQSVVSGEVPAKTHIAYYTNKLKNYTEDRINQIVALSKIYL